MQIQKRQDYLHELLIFENYRHLVITGAGDYRCPKLPYIGRLIQETATELSIHLLDQAIKEAIDRNEHEEIYGMDKFEFQDRIYKQALSGFESPTVNHKDLQYAVFHYMNGVYLPYYNWDWQVANSPIGRGIW